MYDGKVYRKLQQGVKKCFEAKAKVQAKAKAKERAKA
jgi:hypothetical protein